MKIIISCAPEQVDKEWEKLGTLVEQIQLAAEGQQRGVCEKKKGYIKCYNHE